METTSIGEFIKELLKCDLTNPKVECLGEDPNPYYVFDFNGHTSLDEYEGFIDKIKFNTINEIIDNIIDSKLNKELILYFTGILNRLQVIRKKFVKKTLSSIQVYYRRNDFKWPKKFSDKELRNYFIVSEFLKLQYHAINEIITFLNTYLDLYTKLFSNYIEKEDIEQRTKLKWLGSPSQFGYLFQTLVQQGFIEHPKGKGKIDSISKFSNIVIELFDINTTTGTLEKELNPRWNSLTPANKGDFTIPPMKDLS